jgi:hypothetical protein
MSGRKIRHIPASGGDGHRRMGRYVPGRLMLKYVAVAVVVSWCRWCVGALAIQPIEPAEGDFFAKSLSYQGIAIKAPKEVVDVALVAAYERLAMLLSNQPIVVSNLVSAGAELHIIGREQVTSDLPEHRHLKGKKLEQYHGLTVDQRTRGLGGLLTSCGEENLLKLEKDRYKGRDICVHEFAHNIRQHGVPRDIRKRFDEQYRKSLDKGLWEKS